MTSITITSMKSLFITLFILGFSLINGKFLRRTSQNPNYPYPPNADLEDPTANMNFTQYCQYYNYPVETHYITTADGYILTFFRIQAKYSTIKPGLKVVYLQHGLIDSSDDWIINDEPNAPGFMIANRGYDVWLGNNRGNKYSLAHVSLNPNDAAFWQFTWQDFTLYDLPAAFTYISQQTGQKIHYVGHSQGTTQMFAALSLQNPIILDNIMSFSAAAPVAFVNHQSSNLLGFVASSSFGPLVNEFGIEDFLPSNWETTDFGEAFCTLFGWACTNVLGFIADANTTVDNTARFPIFMGHVPAGTSTLNMLHWRQMVLQTSYTFEFYNFGTQGNEAVYGQPNPPVMNLSSINIPVHLFAGLYDRLGDPVDVAQLRVELTSSPNVTYNAYPYGHMTFMWGLNSDYVQDLFGVFAYYDTLAEQQQQQESIERTKEKRIDE